MYVFLFCHTNAADDWSKPLRSTVDSTGSTGSTRPGLSRLRVLVQSAAFKVLALALCCWHQGPSDGTHLKSSQHLEELWILSDFELLELIKQRFIFSAPALRHRRLWHKKSSCWKALHRTFWFVLLDAFLNTSWDEAPRNAEKCQDCSSYRSARKRVKLLLNYLKREFCHVSMFGPGGHALCSNKCANRLPLSTASTV